MPERVLEPAKKSRCQQQLDVVQQSAGPSGRNGTFSAGSSPTPRGRGELGLQLGNVLAAA